MTCGLSGTRRGGPGRREPTSIAPLLRVAGTPPRAPGELRRLTPLPRRFLGTAGQNVSDIFRYSSMEDHLEILEWTLRVRHISPTAPDTLGKARGPAVWVGQRQGSCGPGCPAGSTWIGLCWPCPEHDAVWELPWSCPRSAVGPFSRLLPFLQKRPVHLSGVPTRLLLWQHPQLWLQNHPR